jgi:hypothetical protein
MTTSDDVRREGLAEQDSTPGVARSPARGCQEIPTFCACVDSVTVFTDAEDHTWT